METEELQKSLETYVARLEDVEVALQTTGDGSDKNDLLSLKNDLQELIDLTKESLHRIKASTNTHESNGDQLADEYALFMEEMEKEGAISESAVGRGTGGEASGSGEENVDSIHEELKSLEGMKCRAPHKHQWGDVVYHNAMVCSVTMPSTLNYSDINVKVMFTNPTHQEMLPCPFYLETDCKFSEEQCRYSHGETVSFSSLQEYVEPDFDTLSVGSKVLVKSVNKLWSRGKITRLFPEKCLVKLESNTKEKEVNLHDVFPLLGSDSEEDTSSEDSEDDEDREDIINLSLMTPTMNQAAGSWEKHTKGIGSKLMERMGYVVGTGLGKNCDGRIEPVTAVILPAGKSLDHCMKLREKAGGDKDLFSVEKKLKRLQRQQEIRSQKAYEREKNKVDVFQFLNNQLGRKDSESLQSLKSKHRKSIQQESSKDLNVASLKIGEDIKRCERDIWQIRESLTRHTDAKLQMHKNLILRLNMKLEELKALQTKATNIHHEQGMRNDKRKLTVF